MWDKLKNMGKFQVAIFSGLIGEIINFMFGNNPQHMVYLKSLLFIIFIDLIVGTLRAKAEGNFSKRLLWLGISRKIVELLLIAVSYQIDKIGVFGSTIILEPIALYGYIFYEIYSIRTNAVAIGTPIPKQLNDAIDKINNKQGGGVDG